MDYVAARGIVLATRIEGGGSIGDLSPAPPHCQQVAAEPPPPPPARVCTARAIPTPEPPPSPPNSTQTPTPPQAGTQERPQTGPPKKEEAPGGVLQRGVVQRLLNGLLLGVHHRLLGVRRAPAPPPGQGAHQTPSQGPQRAPPPPTPTQVKGQGKGKSGGGGANTKRGTKFMSFFGTMGSGGSSRAKRPLPRVAPLGLGRRGSPSPKTPNYSPARERRFGKPRHRRTSSSPR